MIHLADTDLRTLLALFAVATFAAGFDAIAGGGVLLTLPALLLAGLDPAAALGTNKLQGSSGSVSAVIVFARRGLIERQHALPFVFGAAFGAIIGALCATALPRDLLRSLVPPILIAVAVYFAFAHRPRATEARARIAPHVFAGLGLTTIGFYDGVFGPGAGSFYMIGFVTLLGYGLLRATAHTKLANAASNLGALACFAIAGKIVWTIGLVMGLGAFVGGQIGSRLAISHGARLIRPLLVTISLGMAIKLLLDPTNPWRQATTRLLAQVGL